MIYEVRQNIEGKFYYQVLGDTVGPFETENEAHTEGQAALKLAEGQKPPANSDYAAAIRCYNEWEALLLANKNCSLNFRDHCQHRLNAAKARHRA